MRFNLLRFSLLSLLVMLCGMWSSAFAADGWVKTSPAELQTGDIVVIVDEASSRAMSNDQGTAKAPVATQVTLSDDKSEISSEVTANLQWTVTISNGSYKFSTGNDSLYCTNTNNGMRVGTNSNNAFTIFDNSGVNFLLNTATSRYVGVYNNSDWRCYTSINANIKETITSFYKKTSDGQTDTRLTTSMTLNFANGMIPTSGTVGQEIEAPSPTIVGANGNVLSYEEATVTWSSSNATVAEFVEGKMALKNVGKATMTATYAGNDTYKGCSASYELTVTAEAYTSFAALQADATATSTPVAIQFNGQQVVFVNGSNAFLTDREGYGLLVYTQDHGLTDGDLLTGTINCNLTIYQGNTEITGFDKSNLTITNADVDPVNTTIGAITTANQSTLVKLKNVMYDSETQTLVSGTDSIVFYDKFKTNATLVHGEKYDITGIVVIYNKKIEICPRTANDIEEATEQGEDPDEDTNILYSWDAGSEKGGKAEASNTTDVGAANGPYEKVIILSGKNDFSTNTVTITLDNELKAGDKIAITGYRNKNAADKQTGALLKFDKGGEVSTYTTGLEFVNIDQSEESAADQNRGTEPNTVTLTVPAAADGSTIITMTRAKTQTNLFITKLVITGECGGSVDPDPDPEPQPHELVELVWDYTENKIPTSGSDNGLYYAGYVNDAPSTNMGLNGVKLNSSGYAYFEKPAVAGTLTLTISNRKNADAFAVNVYACTIAEGAATKGDLIGEVAVDAGPGTGSIDIAADVTGIYIERKTATEGVLQKIVFKEKVARTFVDFEITNDELSKEFDASKLPAGVTFTGTQRNDSHGYGNVTITVPVDGTVKFTIGGCQYANPATCKVINAEGKLLAEPNLKTATCYHQDGAAATYIYIGEPTTLQFTDIAYLPYFKAEATEVAEAEITFKDQNNNVLGTKKVFEGDPIGEIPYTEADLTIPEGMKFRGWIYTNNIKVKSTDIVTGNVTVKASVTSIEEAPTVGSIQTYDLTQATFYPEDHENFSVENAAYFNNHGFTFAEGGSFTVAVTGKAQIVLTLCQYGNGTTIQVVDAEGKVVRDDVPAKAEVDGGTAIVNYEGAAGLLKFTFAAQTYLHKVTVYNVSDFIAKDEQSGYYIIPSGDGAGLILALNAAAAEPDSKIFLPNGTYDLGEATLTAISGKNVSVIGQSMEGVTIKNAPAVEMEGLGKADLFNNTSEGLFMQDLTLQNALDYYKAGTGRAATLHDQGTKTINKNVRHLSYQDTYYSHKVGGLYYFEGGEIHGTVDYLCGNGKVYFNEVKLVNEKRSSATITANSELYVFNKCTVENHADKYNLGRAWSDNPVCIYLNTTLLDGGQNLVATRWNLSGINCDYSIAGEYNTMDAAGNNITPSENIVTFTKQNTTLNTILSAEMAARYSIENVLGEWAATAQADCKQVEAPTAQFENGNIVWEAVTGATAYAIFKDDVLVAITTETSILADYDTNSAYTIRSANARGGFGAAAEVTGGNPTSINTVKAENGNNVIYNMQGIRVEKAQKGLYIVNGKKVVMK